jgi:CBS domain-containing protein
MSMSDMSTEKTCVRDLMEPDLILIDPEASLEDAALKMKDSGCGALPVGSEGIPEGIITDRDIVIRAVAEGKDPKTEKVRDYMTADLCTCDEADTLEDAARTMNDEAVGRLVVKDAEGNVCGILTFGHIIRTNRNRMETSDVVDKATGQAA